MSQQEKMTIEGAWTAFASTDVDVRTRSAALTTLISEKVLPKQADDSRLMMGRQALLAVAASCPDEAERLLAIAESVRLTQVVKRWQSEVFESLDSAFSTPLPSLQILPEADHRLNVARACRQFARPWMPAFLALSVAEEEQGEKARGELLAGLIESAENLSDAVALLAQSFLEQRPATENPGDTMGRRLARTCVSLRPILMESEKELGENFGDHFFGLVQGAFINVGRPTDVRVSSDVADEVLLTLHDLLRTRLSAVVDPSMYRVVGYCRQMFENRLWPDSLKKTLERLIGDISEALILLGKQGKADRMLREQLEALCNYPEKAKALSKKLAEKHPELPEDIRAWLVSGQFRSTTVASDDVEDAAAAASDGALALAYLASRASAQECSAIGDSAISSLELYEPQLANATSGLFQRLNALFVQIESVAKSRRLGLLGTAGAEMEFSAKYFEMIGNNPRQRMIVRQPAVVRVRDDGTTGLVVLKGLVE